MALRADSHGMEATYSNRKWQSRSPTSRSISLEVTVDLRISERCSGDLQKDGWLYLYRAKVITKWGHRSRSRDNWFGGQIWRNCRTSNPNCPLLPKDTGSQMGYVITTSYFAVSHPARHPKADKHNTCSETL